MAILTCPGCGRGGLRVPNGRRGKVTCPTCGAEWFHPETVEFSEVEFRCSKSGARFAVTCSRRSPLHKFIVKEIKKAASAATRPPMESSPASPQAVLPSMRLSTAKMVEWLTRIAGSKTNLVATGSVSAPAPRQEPSGVSAEVSTHDASEYNWSGFACPYWRRQLCPMRGRPFSLRRHSRAEEWAPVPSMLLRRGGIYLWGDPIR